MLKSVSNSDNYQKVLDYVGETDELFSKSKNPVEELMSQIYYYGIHGWDVETLAYQIIDNILTEKLSNPSKYGEIDDTFGTEMLLDTHLNDFRNDPIEYINIYEMSSNKDLNPDKDFTYYRNKYFDYVFNLLNSYII